MNSASVFVALGDFDRVLQMRGELFPALGLAIELLQGRDRVFVAAIDLKHGFVDFDGVVRIVQLLGEHAAERDTHAHALLCRLRFDGVQNAKYLRDFIPRLQLAEVAFEARQDADIDRRQLPRLLQRAYRGFRFEHAVTPHQAQAQHEFHALFRVFGEVCLLIENFGERRPLLGLLIDVVERSERAHVAVIGVQDPAIPLLALLDIVHLLPIQIAGAQRQIELQDRIGDRLDFGRIELDELAPVSVLRRQLLDLGAHGLIA